MKTVRAIVSAIVWLGLRLALLPIGWVLAHATALILKATYVDYNYFANWVLTYVFKPLHPHAVKIVDMIMPSLSTLIRNLPPGEHAVDSVLYGTLMTMYVGIIIFAVRVVWGVIRGI